MKYTLEIQKLLLQAQNKNLHPREKANLLKEAIRIADENEDVEWATEMRLDLIYELNLLSAALRRLPCSLRFWMIMRIIRM